MVEGACLLAFKLCLLNSTPFHWLRVRDGAVDRAL
jgi:hypothetical protein